jgi:hypothetical protein
MYVETFVRAVLLISLSGAWGCASVGSNFFYEGHSRLVPGRTTEKKAISLLESRPTSRMVTLPDVEPPTWGKPELDSDLPYVAQTVRPERGDYLLEWKYQTEELFGGLHGKTVVLHFDSKGILKAVVKHDEWRIGPE